MNYFDMLYLEKEIKILRGNSRILVIANYYLEIDS